MPIERHRVDNFGGNIAFVPAASYRPRDAEEVLACLRRHPGERIRCIGAGHSWSPVLATDGVLLDLRHLNHVEIDASARLVRVGAGCTLGRLLGALRREALTLPTLGAITRQSVAGATSTGTHGSGAPSLSHFVEEVSVASFDPATRAPRIVQFRDGPELRAARCALGCLGIVVEIVFRVRPTYRIVEIAQKTAATRNVLGGAREWPLQQFALLPWSWTYLVYRRKETSEPVNLPRALLCRAWSLVVNDVFLHLLLKGLLLYARIAGERVIRSFFIRLTRHIVTGPRRVDDSKAILTLHHDCFRHVEMELFVPAPCLRRAIVAIRQLVRIAGGVTARLGPLGALRPELREEAWKLRGAYTLHYPLFFRRVEQDDTLVSMAAAGAQPGEDWYSISLFTYRDAGEEFARFAGTVARCMIELCGARLHWGKYFPIPLQAAAASYPRYAEFREICRRYDPQQRHWY
jgi:hypothetical protein